AEHGQLQDGSPAPTPAAPLRRPVALVPGPPPCTAFPDLAPALAPDNPAVARRPPPRARSRPAGRGAGRCSVEEGLLEAGRQGCRGRLRRAARRRRRAGRRRGGPPRHSRDHGRVPLVRRSGGRTGRLDPHLLLGRPVEGAERVGESAHAGGGQAHQRRRSSDTGTTGLRTWQACIALSNHLIAAPHVLERSSRIIELGAGVGLLSLVAARLWRAAGRRGRIIATDVDEKVLDVLTSNLGLNELDDLARCSKLDWELAADLDAHGDELSQWERQAFDDGRAELILGADIVYDPSLAVLLAATLAWLLRPATDVDTPPPQALIAGTVRNESTWATFLDECERRRLRVEPVELEEPPQQGGLVGAEGWEGEGEVRLVHLTAL
ncbi:uncharacterized protein RHOBADRAFT_53092, partial [Rhodotorula graminis WP1]